MPKKPDGVIVYPDMLASGVITAVLEVGIRVVPPKMKFVFHRNAHFRLLCPFPVTWVISDENDVARALVELIQRQFKGKKTSPIVVPYTLKTEQALME